MISCLWFGLLFLLLFRNQTERNVSGAVFCVFVSFVFSEPDQTRPDYPFLGSWIGSHPHRFVRIVRCVVDRDAVERGYLFPGMISREIDVPYVKIDIPFFDF